jgi:hypothetical protein
MQALPEPDVDALESLAAIDSALADLAGSSTRREGYDRKAAEAFRRAVAIAESRDLADLATDPVLARLRSRPELAAPLWDRIFPSDPFVP